MKKLYLVVWFFFALPAYSALVQSTGLQCADAATTQVFSFATLPAVNNYVFVLSSRYAGGGTGTGNITFSDNQSNTWDFVTDRGNTSNYESIGYAKVTTSSGTFTITLSMAGSTSGNYYCSDAIEWSNVTAATPVYDVTLTAVGSGMSQNTGTTATTTQANDLVLAVLSGDGGNPMNISTPASAGYTSLAVQQNASAHIGFEASYKTVAATGTQSAAWTTTVTSTWSVGIGTFKINAAAGGAVPRLTMLGVGP